MDLGDDLQSFCLGEPHRPRGNGRGIPNVPDRGRITVLPILKLKQIPVILKHSLHA